MNRNPLHAKAIEPLPHRVRGATLERAALRELRENPGWDTSEQACLKILEWLRGQR
jgi:hypothetical protein